MAPSDTTSGGTSDAQPPGTSSQDETRVLPVTPPADPTRILPATPDAAPTRVTQAMHAAAAASSDPAAATTLPPEPPAGVPRPATPLAPGDNFGDFEIEAELGRGEMGIVYRVRRRLLDRVEALKIIAPKYAEDPEYAERFLREAALAALARHPNIVTVYDDGDQEGRLYLAMEYVDGEDLRKRIAVGGPLEPSDAAEIIRQVADALNAAHEAGLVHRDVKPANILLAKRHGRNHAYLTDFGVSRRVVATDDLTQPGTFVGAPAYASPEQHLGQAVGAPTDIYSLGCVLFEMLTGDVPFRGATPTAVALAHVTEPAPAPTVLNRTVPAAFDAVIARALAKDPGDRYATALELGDAAVAAAQAAVDAPTQILHGVPDSDSAAATMIRPTVATETPADEPAAETLVRSPETAIRPAAEQLPPARPRPARRGRSRAIIAVAAVIAVGAAVGIGLAAAGGGGSGESATVVPKQGANVHAGPNVDATVITALVASKTVTVSCWTEGSGAGRGWVRLQSPDSGGYVAADLLNPVIDSPQC